MTAKLNGYISGIERIEVTQEVLYADGVAVLGLALDNMEMNWHFAPSGQGRRSWLAARRFKRSRTYVLHVEDRTDAESRTYDVGSLAVDTAATGWYNRFSRRGARDGATTTASEMADEDAAAERAEADDPAHGEAAGTEA